MATPIDIGLLGSFSGVFVFVFVFAISYAVLGVTNVLGKENKNINGIVAFCIAIFLTLASQPRDIITNMIPWFALAIVFFMFLMLAMRYVFGSAEAGDKILRSVLGNSDSAAGWWIFIIIVTILVVAVSSSVGPQVTPGGSNTTTTTTTATTSSTPDVNTGNWQANVLNTLFHPKVLGAVMVLIIALAAIQLLSRVAMPK